MSTPNAAAPGCITGPGRPSCASSPDCSASSRPPSREPRQRIMMLFAQGAELSVGHVAERVGISQATASQQLNLLRRGRVVTSRRDGKTVYYRADRDGAQAALAELQSYLNTCC
ncbi:helix-turn-helix domain-containing protein [Micromonospora sp. WMMD1155]|uniref:ArsR/SmtB family transcription factor n=1 Tax=Micromonospora sp. WMMD1155 TaxID=3016094 RepID=UPI00249C3B2F|nr:helix-turn-helix domain-containing protein [Micromonospora sp. WMMD1155]WFE49462.1 helix-turn-helix domain-containing protein [Micromonospora sp. WMMD1155]